MYDLANTSFTFGIVALCVPQLIRATRGKAGADWWVGILELATDLPLPLDAGGPDQGVEVPA